MFLKAIEIQGFKSFPDKTKITFEGGITAVVGPNGSGKSNVSDAIRWVLGETSSKQLRGAGKMEDVIFGGTQQRTAMGYAAVSLYINNATRRLDIDNDEIVINRRYYRSGESEYGINGQNVRLKDIYELFLDTGIGRDGYSIIGQGKIAEIVGAKSGERREIFEEASGIAKYRYRKNEAERRLNSTEDNLVRLRDILDELTARVAPLEKESNKAQEFLKLSEKRKKNEIALWTDTLRKSKDNIRNTVRNIETAQIDYNSTNKNIENIDDETADIRTEIEKINIEIERKNNTIREISVQVAGADSSVAVLQNDISHNQSSIDRFLEDAKLVGESKSEIAENILVYEEKSKLCEGEIKTLSIRINELEELLQDLAKKGEASGERREIILTKVTELNQKVTDLKVSAAHSKSVVQSSKERLEIITRDNQSKNDIILKLKNEKNETQTFLNDCNEKLTRYNNIKEGLTLKYESRKKNLELAQQSLEQVDRQYASSNDRVRILKELENSMDGYSQSVKFVAKAAENRRLRGILGPISTIITVKNGYELAIETALGYAAQNIVVSDETAAKAAMSLLKQERAGRATFLPIDTVKPSNFEKNRLPNGASLASELVSYDSKYTNIISSLLGRIIIVDDINSASIVAKEMGYRNRIVTLDGQVINAGGSFTGGSVSRSAGLFTRRTEIDEIKVKLEKLLETRKQNQFETEKLKAETQKLGAELTAIDSEFIIANEDKIRAESENSRLTLSLSQYTTDIQLATDEQTQLEDLIEKSVAKEEDSTMTSALVENESLILNNELTGIADGDDSFSETRTRLSDELSNCKMQRLSKEKDLELSMHNINTYKLSTDESTQRAEYISDNIKALEKSIFESKEKIETAQKDKLNATGMINKLEEEIRSTTDNRLEKEGSITQQTTKIRELQNNRELVSREITRLEERKSALEIEYDQTTQKLWEEYELTPTEAAEFETPADNIQDLKRIVAEIRSAIKALGNVNVGAIEEYAEVKQRYEFMTEQVGDVEKSKAELLRLIEELSGEMKEIFSKSFVEINKNFSRIFTELFGGGTADLSLSDPENVLDSGIDITVAPPGKIIKNLSSLSGGEQALVAISIYFAILAVNPAPFCVLDEIEAALDDVNVVRYASYLRKITKNTQFIVITHRRGTMEEADVLYGVTMQDNGISKLLRLDANNIDVKLIS